MAGPAQGVAGAAAAPEPDLGGRAGAVTPRPARRVWVAAFTAAGIALFAAYIRLSATYPVNSDGANIILMSRDMLHGNAALHGWWMWTCPLHTKLPEYVLLDAIRGLSPDVTHIAAALTYTLVLVLAALLAKGGCGGGKQGRATSGEGWPARRSRPGSCWRRSWARASLSCCCRSGTSAPRCPPWPSGCCWTWPGPAGTCRSWPGWCWPGPWSPTPSCWWSPSCRWSSWRRPGRCGWWPAGPRCGPPGTRCPWPGRPARRSACRGSGSRPSARPAASPCTRSRSARPPRASWGGTP